MRVLVVGPGRMDPGGVANYYNAVFPRLTDDSITAHYLEIGSTRGRSRFLHVFLDQVRFWQTLGRLIPDIVHLNPSLNPKSFFRDGLFILLAKKRRTPVLVFFRGWEEGFEQGVSGPFKWFFKLTYRRADGFVVLGKTFAERLRNWGISAPIFRGTTAVANELLEDFSIDEKIEEIKREGDIRLLYLARLEREKGVLQLIDAIRTLLDRGIHVTLTIAGDGPMMSQVRQLVTNLDQDNIKIVGYVRGKVKKDILCSHDIFCFPTQYGEGMPNSILEAMAFGMPIITCPVGGITDFFENKKMGILLTDRSAQHIADAIESLARNHNQLANIARYNHEYARSHFLASTAADTLRTRYQEIMNSEINRTE